jgi:RNA recognition motif-containing protein
MTTRNCDDRALIVYRLDVTTTNQSLESFFADLLERSKDKIRADIIRAKDTGLSRQYAFVHFSSKRWCKEAHTQIESKKDDKQALILDGKKITTKIAKHDPILWEIYRKHPNFHDRNDKLQSTGCHGSSSSHPTHSTSKSDSKLRRSERVVKSKSKGFDNVTDSDFIDRSRYRTPHKDSTRRPSKRVSKSKSRDCDNVGYGRDDDFIGGSNSRKRKHSRHRTPQNDSKRRPSKRACKLKCKG